MGIDIHKFVTHLRENSLPPFGRGKCAKYVRLALEAGGANTVGHLVDAKTYGPILLKNGYRLLVAGISETWVPMMGDVAVIKPTKKGNQAGHIQAWDGKSWISDFVQREFWPGKDYREEKPGYEIYRSN
jgi:hypothetical protein